MKLLLIFGLAALGIFAWVEDAPHQAEARISTRVLVPDVTAFGVNLGNWTAWGAEQLSANVLKNPGFEGVIDRAIVLPQHALGGGFDDAPAWLARPDSFWDGARYEVRTGAQAGSGGVVAHSLAHNIFGLPAFVAKDGDKLPDPGDVVALSKETNDALPTQWWFAGPAGSFSPANGETRPGSPGTRSLRIHSQAGNPVEVDSYFDAIGERAGKLLPLTGAWTLSFWVRAQEGAPRLHVTVGRDGSAPVLSQDVVLSGAWSNPHLTFTGTDDGPPGVVSLRFQVAGQPAGQILLDDVDLRRVEDEGFPFRKEVVSVLEQLHPRYLRDWEGQLGDTLANRIAPAFARKAYRYRPGDASQTDYGYGLRDFLDLCVRVHADPWIVVPTTFSDEECSGLGDYLTAQRDAKGFHELILEFGNENWNEVFRPAGIPDAALHGQTADRCFGSIRQHTAGLPVKLAINAQHAWVERALNFARESQAANIEAVAPYFLPSLAKNTPLNDALHSLFAGDERRLKQIATALPSLHKDIAVYEVNLTTTAGTAPGEERTPIVAGVASGSALAKTMLDALAEGARRQCVYALSGFDAQLPDNEGFVRLWGITRDLGPTSRLRPTGLALELLNRVVSGNMVQVEVRGAKDTSVYAFRSPRGWAVALVSARATAGKIDLEFPEAAGSSLPGEMFSFDAKSAGATNENAADVRLSRCPVQVSGNRVSVELAPWALAVLLPPGGAE